MGILIRAYQKGEKVFGPYIMGEAKVSDISDSVLKWMKDSGYNPEFIKKYKEHFNVSDADLIKSILVTEGLAKRENSFLLKKIVPRFIIDLAKYFHFITPDEDSVGPMNIKLNTNFKKDDKEFFNKKLGVKVDDDFLEGDNNAKNAALYINLKNGVESKELNDKDYHNSLYEDYTNDKHHNTHYKIYLKGFEDALNKYLSINSKNVKNK